ncbi:BRI3-like protein [Mya arenaria]|uniref:Membrane protein BRI3 n=1 Tax=Mya arenaria TaxID=6604 RepID=A0ABY7DGK3_MYAAR|nr:brain protein I3-like [Mya arenaria]WAQ96408.1 BRI3-like protein [Mya arenaria]
MSNTPQYDVKHHGTPQQGYPPPQQGYPPPQQGYAPTQQGYAQQTTTVIATGPQLAVNPGGCPACGVGTISDRFTIIGIIIAILFFPLGIICCLMMTERRCGSCGATY